jgi:hypothetical protein
VTFALTAALMGEPAPRSALLGFASAVVICALTFVLAARATRVALREAHRRSRALLPSAPSSSGGPQHFGDLLGVGAAAGVEALMGVVALTALSLASLLA